MSSDRTTHSAATLLLRHSVEFLTALGLLFIIQAGLVPFDFVDEPAAGARVFFDTRTDNTTFPDLISNIFLYVPLGILAHLSLCRILPWGAITGPAAVALCLLLSGTIEWVQAYSNTRVSSAVDLVANVAGGALGTSLSWIGQRFVPKILGAAIYEFHERPAAAILKSYCLVLVIFAALPFSFSVDVGRLKQAAKAANFVPFGVIDNDQALIGAAAASGDQTAVAHAKWRYLKRWSRWAAETASFIVLAWLSRHLFRRLYGFSRRATTALVWWCCGIFAVALSVIQLPVLTRGFDTTDILFRLLGLGLGLLIYPAYLRSGSSVPTSILDERWRRMAWMGCICVGLYIVYTGAIPATFESGEGAVLAAVTSKSFLPFMSYFVTRFDVMMTDVMEKFASTAVFAALLATSWRRVRGRTLGAKLAYIAPVCLVLSVAIEATQMFIPVRVTALSDPMLALAGCVVGVVAQQHAVDFFRFAATHDVLASHPLRSSPPGRPEHKLTDTLVASLMNPDENAPAESVPERRGVPQP